MTRSSHPTGAVLIARNPVPPLSPLAARVLAGAMLLAAATLPVAAAFLTHQTAVMTAVSR